MATTIDSAKRENDNLFVEHVSVKNVSAEKNVKIISPTNLYNCYLAENVFIGPFVEVQTGARIGKNTKVQSHSFICEGVIIGSDCFIGHGVMFINDTFENNGPANGDKTKWRNTEISDRVFIGSNATILPVKICEDVIIGAGAVITKDITKPGTYSGNPARKHD